MNHRFTWTNKKKFQQRDTLLELFFTFFKIGLFTFGSGLAMLSLIEEECVEKRHWITHEKLVDVTVIAESTPGPVAINSATFVGFQQAGILGAVLATMGVVLPSFVIIYVIALFMDNFLEFTIVVNALKGIAVAVGITILDVGISMMKEMKKNKQSIGIMFAAFVLMMLTDIFAWNLSSVILLLMAALFSLVMFQIKKIHGKRGRVK